MKVINLGLRFLLELAALCALGYWGATMVASPAARMTLATGLPLAAAGFWKTFVAPPARVVLSTPVRMMLGLAVFTSAAAALADRGHGWLAVGFATAAVGNSALMLAWRQDRIIARDAV